MVTFEDVSKETLQRLYWDKRKTLTAIGEIYGRKAGTINDWMRKRAIPTRSRKVAANCKVNIITDTEKAEMERLYLEGLSSYDIGKKLGRNGRNVREHLSRVGLSRSMEEAINLAVSQGKIRTIGRTLRLDFFDTFTPESAWVLGLIYGDGHVMNRPDIGTYGVALAGTEAVCEKVAKLVNPALHVRKMKDAECWIVCWFSKEQVKRLAKHGLYGGNKARIIEVPFIPQEFMGHFVRGLWDSDGSWKRATSYTSASIKFCTQLKAVLEAKGIATGKLREIKQQLEEGGEWFTCYQFCVERSHRVRLAEWLYSDATPAIYCESKLFDAGGEVAQK